MNLTCSNPNYIVKYYEKNRITDEESVKIDFIRREEYLDNNSNPFRRYYVTRCGKCLACRLYRGYTWSNRMVAESKNWNYIYFLTMTYREENYDIDYLLETKMRDFQLFMKRLRKEFKNQKFKYYATGELGGNTLRFHYHVILFSNVHIFNDMRYFKQKLYTSATLNRIWSNGMNNTIAWATPDTMRYCANYVTEGEKNEICHSFSRNIGIDFMTDTQENGMYVVGGRYSPITRTLKNKLVDLEVLSDKIDYKEMKRIEELSPYDFIINHSERIATKNLKRKKT